MGILPIPRPKYPFGELCSVGWKEVKGDLGGSHWWVAIGNWPPMEQLPDRSQHGAWKAPATKGREEGREENCFIASQAAAHTCQPYFGVGAVRYNFYSPIGVPHLFTKYGKLGMRLRFG